MKFWRCLDCDRLYDIDVDKCVECGSDNWQKISATKYIEITEARLRALKAQFGAKIRLTSASIKEKDK